ncbi:MAG: MoaD family protein [Candidatus Helarchaeota archaeon]|nr:MoaD family protein [Candidatus Helarchaeota archaeon]
MSKVKFLFFSSLQDLTQSNTIEININGTVKDALDLIFELYGDPLKNRVFDQNSGKIKRYIIVAVNRKDIRHLNGLDTNLNEGDEISLLPAAAGG